MGLIARALETRMDPGWLTRDDDVDGGSNSPSGVRVTARTALSLSTVWRCVDLLASSVSQAPKDVVVKIGGRSYPEYRNRPGWLDTPNPQNPAYTANDYFNQVAVSLLTDGNYFTYAAPYVWDAQRLILLDPKRVDVRPGPSGPLYDVRDSSGHLVMTLTPMEVLHGTWLTLPGELRGVAPLEAMRRGVGAAIAADDFAARFFGQGASLSFGVEVPGDLPEPKRDQLRDSLRRRHQGLGNSHAIGILTQGAKFVSGLAPTPEQAQMLETRKFAVEDICRAYGVPPHLVGSQQPGASSHASAQVFDAQFAERGVLPLAVRIETQHTRLLTVPAGVGDPNATVQFKFNLDHLYRTDMLSRFQAYQLGINAGVMKPDEAREKEDLAPAGGAADQLYMQGAMVPLGQTLVPSPEPSTKGAPA